MAIDTPGYWKRFKRYRATDEGVLPIESVIEFYEEPEHLNLISRIQVFSDDSGGYVENGVLARGEYPEGRIIEFPSYTDAILFYYREKRGMLKGNEQYNVIKDI